MFHRTHNPLIGFQAVPPLYQCPFHIIQIDFSVGTGSKNTIGAIVIIVKYGYTLFAVRLQPQRKSGDGISVPVNQIDAGGGGKKVLQFTVFQRIDLINFTVNRPIDFLFPQYSSRVIQQIDGMGLILHK